MPVRSLAAALVLAFLVCPTRAAAHGETVRGGGAGGINTVGAIISAGYLSAGLRLEIRHFDRFSDDELRAFAMLGEDVHQHAQELSAILSGSYALDESWSLNAALQVNAFRDFREATLESGMPALVVDDFSGGLGDLLLLARYRPWQDAFHHIALLGGIKLPTGSTYETNNDGERQGAHNQPGTGSIDFQLGLAYSLAIDWFELDADVIAHVRTEGAMSFQSGNLLQADLALSANVWQLTFVVELNFLVSEHDIENDEVLRNSGIASLYLSPGVVMRLGDEHAIFASFSYPAWQELPGIQNNEAFRASVGYALAVDVAHVAAPSHEHGADGHTHGGGAGHTHDHGGDTHDHGGGADHAREHDGTHGDGAGSGGAEVHDVGSASPDSSAEAPSREADEPRDGAMIDASSASHDAGSSE